MQIDEADEEGQEDSLTNFTLSSERMHAWPRRNMQQSAIEQDQGK